MTSFTLDQIRNFCIIAHVDHGKSTLADRLLEICGALTQREMQNQYLDRMDLERERGITIKAQAARLTFKSKNGKTYQFNLIDTPGHVDFSYEVSRSLAACEGAVLLIDSSQGVQAQTLAHTYHAIDLNLEVLPAWNKIDLPNSDLVRAKQEVENLIGLDTKDTLPISAKLGTNVSELLEQVIQKIPPPKGNVEAPLKALLFDSWYDSYLGVVCLVRLFDGSIRKGMKIQMMSTKHEFEVDQVGVFQPDPVSVKELFAGEVGFISAAIRDVSETKIGDTITEAKRPTSEAFPGFAVLKPKVFCGIFPTSEQNYDDLRDALQKLRLNDSSFSIEPENSSALGMGFRCGFLGLLHMEIIQERLEREFGVSVITTAPNVAYQVKLKTGEVMVVENPAKFPLAQDILEISEPMIRVMIHTPNEYLGAVLSLCEGRRGKQVGMDYPVPGRVFLRYDLPLNEVVLDFHDQLKSVTRGFASLDYEYLGFEPSDVVKVDFLINGNRVDALSIIVHRDNAYYKGRELTKKLKELIHKQMYEVAIQACLGNKVIARETLSALRKNVTAKCYGGDITRKRKLLEKQKEGKKRMKRFGNVDLPQEAFLAILRVN